MFNDDFDENNENTYPAVIIENENDDTSTPLRPPPEKVARTTSEPITVRRLPSFRINSQGMNEFRSIIILYLEIL